MKLGTRKDLRLREGREEKFWVPLWLVREVDHHRSVMAQDVDRTQLSRATPVWTGLRTRGGWT